MEQHDQLRRNGPWTSEEDDKLRNYVNMHGIGHWDTVARELGLGRSGNSCRLRWLNYLSPSVRRGNITDEEMIQILRLHSELGNQWSKIAQQFSGRTDNEIKNFWNTRVKKEAKQLNCDVGSDEFIQIMTARLMERNQLAAGAGGTTARPPPITRMRIPPLAVAGSCCCVCGCGRGTAASSVASSSTGPFVGHPHTEAADCSVDQPQSFQTWL